MPAPLQVKLLRVLQERKVRRWAVTAILISTCGLFLRPTATCQSDDAREFREDLYYRLNVVSLKIPAHGNTEDIPLLANHLLRRAARRHKPFVRAFSTDAMKRLMTASWPGNVRQLVNVIEQCVALTSSPVLVMRWWSRRWRAKKHGAANTLLRRVIRELNYLRAAAKSPKATSPRGENGGAQPDRIL